MSAPAPLSIPESDDVAQHWCRRCSALVLAAAVAIAVGLCEATTWPVVVAAIAAAGSLCLLLSEHQARATRPTHPRHHMEPHR